MTQEQKPDSVREILDEGERLLSLLSQNENGEPNVSGRSQFKFTSVDATALLAYLANTTCYDYDKVMMTNGNETKRKRIVFGRVVRQSCSMILQSENVPAICSPKTARRIASNGLLSLASSLPVNDNWADNLIRSLVALILPTAVIVQRDKGTENDASFGDVDIGTGGNREINTVGLDVLLPSYLARLHSSELMERSCSRTKQLYPQDKIPRSSDDENVNHVTIVQDNTISMMTVDGYLDAICCCATDFTYLLRPNAAAAVASSLKEFESILPNRLIQVLDKKTTGKGDGINLALSSINLTNASDRSITRKRSNESGTSMTEGANKRISCLFQKLLYSLQALARNTDWDSIPPLVYQLCLFVTKVPYCNTLQEDILIGVADLFDNIHELSASSKPANASSSDPNQEAISWTTRTSLTHLSTILRTDPSLSKVLLKILKGQSPKLQKETKYPFRHMCMTPFKMAMGLKMAMAIPRMRTCTLDCLRDLVVEEELIRQKRLSSGWFNACAAVLVTGITSLDVEDEEEDNLEKALTTEVKKYRSQDYDDHCVSISSHLFQCMKKIITAVDDNELNAEDSALYQSLVSLGFLLIDSVKRDSKALLASTAKRGAFILPPFLNCAEITSQSSMPVLMQKSHICASKIGRKLLTFLFVKVWKTANEGVLFGSGGYSTSMYNSAPLCRSILLTASEKFCGMAPNAIEHSYILRDLAFYQNTEQFECAASVTNINSSETMGADMLGATHLPIIIDFLSHIPGGGMPPAVAMVSVIPSLGSVLHQSLCAGKRNVHRRNEVEDQIDHCFILAKKALFCTDVQRRCVAVNILTMLFKLAMKINVNESVTNNVSDSPLIDEIKGYLRRCLTQHQAEVRMEVYASLIELAPLSDDNGDLTSNSKSCNTTCRVFSQILSNHLERYITVFEDVADLEARRRRAMTHGSQLSQCIDLVEGEDSTSGCGQGPPFRAELCITSGNLSSNNKLNLGNNFVKKCQVSYPTILSEALARITEPLPFLLSSGRAMIDKVTEQREIGMGDLCQIISSLRTKVAISKLEHYLNWCEESNKKNTIILSCCLLVASVAETLMDMNCKNEVLESSEFETIKNLFCLRMSAVSKAATIVSQKALNASKGRKKVLKANKNRMKVENGTENQTNKRFSEKNDHTMKPNQHNLEKSKRYVENSISEICPALSPSFLATCMRSCGTVEESGGTKNIINHDQNQKDGYDDPFSQNYQFRRFLLEKSLELLDGNALVIKRGLRFDKLAMMRNDKGALKQIGLHYITCSMQLGHLLLSEFCSHVQDRKTSSLTDESDTPLSLLALRSFISCIRRMGSYVEGHEVRNSKRLSSFLEFCFEKLFCRFPEIKQQWNYLSDNFNQIDDILRKEQNVSLLRNIIPLILPMRSWNSEDPGQLHGGLLSELVAHGLDGEADDCCKMLMYLSYHLNSALKQKISSYMLDCFQCIGSECTAKGLLGLDHDSASSSNGICLSSAACAIDSVILLDGLLDGSTSTLLLNKSLYRKCLGFPDHSGIINENEHSEIGMSDFIGMGDDDFFGISHRMAISFLGIGIGHNFEDLFNANHFTAINKLTLSCAKILSPQQSSGHFASKELVCAANSLSNAIDMGLADSEFVISKLFSSPANCRFLIMQKMVTGRLYAVAKILCSLAPCGENIDNNGSFIAFLLKSSKRLYSVHTKLILSHLARPMSLLCTESKQLLNIISEKFAPRTMKLLLTMQEMSKVGNGKMIADSKIESQGKVAAQVVFEQERRDNALFKISSKLKTDANESEAAWIETKVVESTTRDFKIKKKELQAARDKERQPSRKLKTIKVSKKEGPRKKKLKISQNDNDESINIDEDSENEFSDSGSQSDQNLFNDATGDIIDCEDDPATNSNDELSNTTDSEASVDDD